MPKCPLCIIGFENAYSSEGDCDYEPPRFVMEGSRYAEKEFEYCPHCGSKIVWGIAQNMKHRPFKEIIPNADL